MLKKWKAAAAGLFIGLCNAVFGAGGGLLAVPYFRRQGLAQRDAQALSLSVTLPLSALQAAFSALMLWCGVRLLLGG